MSKRPSPILWLVTLALAVFARPALAVDLKLATTNLSFFTVAGANPPDQVVNAYPSQTIASFSPTVAASTSSGGDWLAVSTTAGGSFYTALVVHVKVNSSKLAVGDYSGTITLAQAGLGGSPGSVAVALKVIPAAPYIVPSMNAINATAMVGTNASSVFLDVRNAGTGQVSPTFTKVTANGGDWLALSAPMASTLSPDVQVRVDFKSAALPAGVYSGLITATAASAGNSPLNIPVQLNVGGSASGALIAFSPASLSFVAGLGQNPAPRALAINNGGQGILQAAVSFTTADGGQWLRVATRSSGSGGGLVATISIDITGLAKGTYTGTIVVSDPGASNSPQSIAVTLAVQDPKPVLSLLVTSLAFSAPVGIVRNSSPLPIGNTGVGALLFTTAVSTDDGNNWLSVSPTLGQAPATINVIADATGLSAGIYHGKVTISVTGAGAEASSPQQVAVTFGVGVKAPTVSAGGIVNSASFTSQVVAPGEIVAAFGTDFGPPEGALASFVGGRLPTTLGGVSVMFDTTAGPLFFTNTQQVNIQVPFELAGKSSTNVQVFRQGLPGPQYTLSLRAADPAVYIAGGRPTIFNGAAHQVLPSEPAAAGDVLVLYATGLGLLDASIGSGAPAPVTPLFNTATKATVTIGGVAADVSFSGLAPTFVGLYQVNFKVPAGLASGDVPLVLSIGSAQSAPLMLALK